MRPIKVQFIRGGLGSKYVTILLESQRGFGINSYFAFYTRFNDPIQVMDE